VIERINKEEGYGSSLGKGDRREQGDGAREK